MTDNEALLCIWKKDFFSNSSIHSQIKSSSGISDAGLGEKAEEMWILIKHLVHFNMKLIAV